MNISAKCSFVVHIHSHRGYTLCVNPSLAFTECFMFNTILEEITFLPHPTNHVTRGGLILHKFCINTLVKCIKFSRRIRRAVPRAYHHPPFRTTRGNQDPASRVEPSVAEFRSWRILGYTESSANEHLHALFFFFVFFPSKHHDSGDRTTYIINFAKYSFTMSIITLSFLLTFLII